MLLCMHLLVCKVGTGSGELMLESKMVESGELQLKVFEFKYSHLTSVNFTSDWEIITQQMERFSKIYERLVKQETRNYCNNLKSPVRDWTTGDIIRELTESYKVKRVRQ